MDDENVSDNAYQVSQGADLQYVYLPFSNYEYCKGKVEVRFFLDAAEEDADAYPALVANHAEIKEAAISVAQIETMTGEQMESDDKVSLKCSHIYTHDTYPFLYDFRILTFVFLAASMTVAYPAIGKRNKDKGEKEHVDER